jgi:hypothetical protein
LFEIVYFRKLKNNDKYKPLYYEINNKKYLKCCNTKYEEKEISYQNHITCNKCFITYKLSNKKVNGIYEIFSIILPEHEITNENEIYKKIKCNQCDIIDKKEIVKCFKCKNKEKCKITEYTLPDINEEGYETKLALAGKCYNTIMYTANIYSKAHKEGLVKNGWNPLIEYIKKNKLMEEKQINIIKNKIIRCNYIMDLYQNEKYKDIQDYIKRLDFSLNSIAKLTDDDFLSFKYDLTEKLNNEVINNNEKNGIFECYFVTKVETNDGNIIEKKCNEKINTKGKCKYHKQFCDLCRKNLDNMCTCNKK